VTNNVYDYQSTCTSATACNVTETGYSSYACDCSPCVAGLYYNKSKCDSSCVSNSCGGTSTSNTMYYCSTGSGLLYTDQNTCNNTCTTTCTRYSSYNTAYECVCSGGSCTNRSGLSSCSTLVGGNCLGGTCQDTSYTAAWSNSKCSTTGTEYFLQCESHCSGGTCSYVSGTTSQYYCATSSSDYYYVVFSSKSACTNSGCGTCRSNTHTVSQYKCSGC
jgi:hypothetical protein